MLIFGLGRRSLTLPVFRTVLRESLAISGALFAWLLAATVFTLVLRAFETDRWMNDFLHGLGGGSTALVVVMRILALSAFVLDAFEITFAIIPVVMPPLLMLVPDAIWVAVLTLLALQVRFLLPPFGYAVVMAASRMGRGVRACAGARPVALSSGGGGGACIGIVVAGHGVA